MKRVATFALALMATSTAMAAPLELHRGVGIHEWLNWSPLSEDGSYRWPPYQTEEQWLTRYRDLSDWPTGDKLAAIRALGFDFVRLTVDPGPLLATEGAKRDEALAVLAGAVRQLTDAGLKVVFNLHSISQVPQYNKDVIEGPAGNPEVSNYIAMTADVARILVPLGTDKVAFEPFNEPQHYPCGERSDGQWPQIMADTVKVLREVSADLTLIATGACGGDVEGLVDLKPDYDDPNILYSFHMYEPHLFTHQRPEVQGGFASGLPWPASAGTPDAVGEALRAHMTAAGLGEAEQQANLDAVATYIEQYFAEDWGPAQLEARVGEALAWADANGVPRERLFLGEFGVMAMSADGRSGAFAADRMRYQAAVRGQAEQHGFPWAVWEYSNPHGMSLIAPEGPAVPDPDMLKALGLTQ